MERGCEGIERKRKREREKVERREKSGGKERRGKYIRMETREEEEEDRRQNIRRGREKTLRM